MNPPHSPFSDPRAPIRRSRWHPSRWPWIPALILAEIVLLVESGRLLGLWPVLGLLAAGVGIGMMVLRHQGTVTLRHAHAALSRGEPPVEAMLHAAGLTLAGILLIIPGFLTGIAGLLLLMPGLRRQAIRRFTRIMAPPMTPGHDPSMTPGHAGPTLDLNADPPDAPPPPDLPPPGTRP